ncbi:hypothetical protein PV325_004346 [Microctonus aethiopoides]|nr:hypothetical protein PV325_004346 [Microctonus aethiopoides]
MYLEHKIVIPTVNDLLPEIENDGDNLHGGAEPIVENLKRIINKIMELVELIRMYMELMNRLDMLLKDQTKVNTNIKLNINDIVMEKIIFHTEIYPNTFGNWNWEKHQIEFRLNCLKNMTPCETNSQGTHQDNLQMDNKQKSNNIVCGPSLYLQQSSMTGKSYKLLIQIDKVRARPGPKSKKRQLMTITTNNYKQLTQCQKIEKKDLNESIKKNDVIINLETDSSCNLPEKNLSAIQDDASIEKNLQCSICQKSFDSNRALFLHKKTHMFCQYCGKQFDRKLLFDYHEKLHFSTDPTLPYKCHLCPTKFSDKQAIKVHNELFHTLDLEVKGEKSIILLGNSFSDKFAMKQLKYQCEICKIFLKNEDLLRSHRASHEVEMKIPNGDITHKTNSKSNHETNTKYSCKVCCKEFGTPAEAEAHTYTHVEIIETEHKCNICKKIFNTQQMLNDHLAHHLSHAYHCVVCRKAFINRITLKIHMRSHKNTK